MALLVSAPLGPGAIVDGPALQGHLQLVQSQADNAGCEPRTAGGEDPTWLDPMAGSYREMEVDVGKWLGVVVKADSQFCWELGN